MENKQLKSSEQNEKVTTKKKPYTPPTLIQYGTIAKLTQGSRSRGKETRRRIV